MSNEIDWTKPLEAYHRDGRVVEVTLSEGTSSGNPDDAGDYYTNESPSGRAFGIWHPNGEEWESNRGWRIRNRTEKPALTEEMVRDVLSPYGSNGGYADGIVSLLREHGVLAEPVEDADLVMAREVAASVRPHSRKSALIVEGHRDASDIVRASLAAIKRVRAEGAGG